MSGISLTGAFGTEKRLSKRVQNSSATKSTNALAISGGTFLLLCGGIIGTAAANTGSPNQNFRISEKQIACTSTIRKKFEKKIDGSTGPVPWARDLAWIRENVGVSVSALADFFGVTRKAFYGWLDGRAVPRGDRVMKIAALKDVLSRIDGAEAAAVFDFVDKETSAGSLREIFSSHANLDEMIERLEYAITELAPQIRLSVERPTGGSLGNYSFLDEFSST